MRKIILALAMLVAGSAQATPTYSFLLDSMVYRDGYAPPGVTVPEHNFQVGKWYLGLMLVSIGSPQVAGSMELHYNGLDGTQSVTFTASNLELRAIGGVKTNPPGCSWAVCDVVADLLRNGSGLSGSLYLNSGEMQLRISGDNDLWSGTWNTDNPYGQYLITGRWHVVPLPGTLALLGLGLLLVARRR